MGLLRLSFFLAEGDEKFIPPFEVKSDASTCWRSAMCHSSATKWKMKN